MITTKIGLSGSHANYGPSLSLVLLLLLLTLRGVLSLEENSGLLTDGIPIKHRNRLELLTTVLAMDEEWSAVWSEKLTPDVVEDVNLVKGFCPSFPKIEENINTLNIVKAIMTHCSHSGMYVKFAVSLVAVSIQCLFNRHVKLQLDAIQSIHQDAINEYASHLDSLEDDFQLIANVLATVNADLVPLITLTKFFKELRRQWPTYIEDNHHLKSYKNKILRKSLDLNEYLDEKNKYCAEDPARWYDQDEKDTVTLSMSTFETNDAAADDPLTDSKNKVPKDRVLKKAHKLRLILRKEFGKLLLGKLPLEVWKLMFENHILVRPIKSKKSKPPGILSKIGAGIKRGGKHMMGK
ncbi:hypothetical protein ACI65C_001664 [Semiaphis heraclei]